jgi:glutamate carboxypeptidase
VETVTLPGGGVSPSVMSALRERIEARLPAFLADLEWLVNTDCGSYTKAGVDEVGRWTGAFLERLGARVEYRDHETLGATVVATFDGTADAGSRSDPAQAHLLMISHLDTVFDPGTARERPFRIDGGIGYGPGVTDMKSGLLAGLYAIDAIRSTSGSLPFGQLVFIANPDEEIGSPSSSPHIRAIAPDMDACLVLECARANGDIVSSRKGILDARLTVIGRAAHAGVEPEKGRNAIVEAARVVRELTALNGRWEGVTVNVGVIAGGTRPNVVPERCRLEVDVRARGRSALEEAEALVRELCATTVVPDIRIEVEEMGRHWPMEKSERSGRLAEHARAIAGQLGFDLHDGATGGASDANTTAGLGIPTLDGLGPIGGNDHSPSEYLEIDSIVPRTTLLAALMLSIAHDPVIRDWRRGRSGA